MLRTTLVILACLTIGLGCCLSMGSIVAAQAPKEASAVKWEYKRLVLGVAETDAAWDKKLNDLGEKGWEVISTTPITQANTTITFNVILKRQKQ
jgi:hypothetical protein